MPQIRIDFILGILFWISVAFILYGYLGYPFIIWLLSHLWPKAIKKSNFQPLVTLLIPAYNEENIIAEKIRNCLDLDYPRDKLEIVVASDGSTDNTCAIVKKYLGQEVRLLEYVKHSGKIMILNTAVPLVKGEIIVFSDASGMLEKNALKELTANFSDPKVGCVSGLYIMEPQDSSLTGLGYSAYLDYDIGIKKAESRFNSTLGAHGAFYAIRKGLFEALPEDLVNDDFYLPMEILAKGYRVVYEANAAVKDRMIYKLEEELRRRVRIGFGNWQQIVKLGRYSDRFSRVIIWQFFSHKILRLFMPFFILASFISSVFLKGIVYKTCFYLFLLLLVLVLLGGVLRLNRLRGELFYLPFYWFIGNVGYLMGTILFFLGVKKIRW